MKTAIDLFAGIGGFTEGATKAGVDVLFAANHWDKAVRYHKINHPETKHATQDLRLIDWNKVPHHDIMLASPCCQGHSLARGKDKKAADVSRQTAWCVIDGLYYKDPQAFVIENVSEIQRWELYSNWLETMNKLGYKVTTQVLNSADFGVPQARKRLFIIGHKKHFIKIQPPVTKHIPAMDVFDWEGGNWRLLSSYGHIVQRQIEPARKLYGDKFYIAYYSSENNGRNPNLPIGTMMTNNHFYLVKGNKARPLTVQEYIRFMGFPTDYRLPPHKTAAMKMLGNAVCPPVVTEVLNQMLRYS